jgi:predicted nucleotidyltransferase
MNETETTLAREITRDQLVAELRALRPVFERAGVTRMVLFGSRARGDNRPDSDVDLAIDIDPERKFSLVDLSGVHLIAEDAIGLHANVMLRRSLRPGLTSALSRDGVAVF